jgi:hypothetical protein
MRHAIIIVVWKPEWYRSTEALTAGTSNHFWQRSIPVIAGRTYNNHNKWYTPNRLNYCVTSIVPTTSPLRHWPYGRCRTLVSFNFEASLSLAIILQPLTPIFFSDHFQHRSTISFLTFQWTFFFWDIITSFTVIFMVYIYIIYESGCRPERPAGWTPLL